MSLLVIFAAAIVVFTIAMLVLRIPSALLLLAVLVGAALQTTLGDSAEFALAGVLRSGPTDLIASAVLLALPVLFTIVLLRKASPRTAIFLQLIPLLLTSAVLAIYVLHLLPTALQGKLYGAPGGAQLQQAEDLIVALAGSLNLLLAWRQYRHKEDAVHGHSKH